MKHISLFCMIFLFSFSHLVQAEEEANLFDSPVNPETYLIRPGDNLTVTFIQSQIKPLKLVIDPEGKIVHETIGLLNLKYQTLAYTKQKLTEILKKLYNVSDIEVSIVSPRKVSIAVYGSVRRPGIYQGLTSDRVSDIIKKAGGISANGSSRDILFKSDNNVINVDLDRANYFGDFIANPHLYAGTVIEVPSKSSNTIQVVGDVNFPREIELNESDDLAMLIQLAGNFNNSAQLSDVQIIRGNESIQNPTLKAGDIIMVKSSHQEKTPIVKLFGAVKNQGLYPFTDNLSLQSILEQAGGYLPEANKSLTTVFRRPLVDSHGEKSQIRYPISIPIDDNNTSSLKLTLHDSIFVPWQVGFVKVSGAVLNPGYFPYERNKDILFYVKSAGGFMPTSNKEEIKMFNPISENTTIVSSEVLVPDGAGVIIQVKEELK